MLALGGGLAVVLLLAWWWMGRSSTDSTPTTVQSETLFPGVRPDIHVEQETLPPARDVETPADIAQPPEPPAPGDEPAVDAEPAATAEAATDPEPPATPESTPEVTPVPEVPDTAAPVPVEPIPVPPKPVSVRFTSPDPQVQIELRGPLDSSPPLTTKAGDVIDVAPGTYRVVVSGDRLETFEQEVRFDGKRSLEYTVELCAVPKRERDNVAGLIVEQHACGSTEQCESLFAILSEHADELIKDGDFRRQQCAKWRDDATPEGRWTLDTQCGGATLATTCRIQIAEGVCTFAEPRRSVRGSACPRAELE